MIYTLSGTVKSVRDNFVVVGVGDSSAGGFGLKVLTHDRALRKLRKQKGVVELFCYLYIRDNELELYGFLDERELKLFEMLRSVSGVGPKTALGILEIDTIERITAAIIEKQTTLLTRTSGIGKKTAERVILELHSKLSILGAGAIIKKMDVDADIEETLVKLGYSRRMVQEALAGLGKEPEKLEERLKEALKLLS